MRKWAVTVLVTGLFLLMLSALVVTPEDAVPPPAPVVHADYHAVFVPPVDPPAPVTARTAENRQPLCSGVKAQSVLAVCGWQDGESRDSNGRVLSALRYENSVYQVFRPEVAGG